MSEEITKIIVDIVESEFDRNKAENLVKIDLMGKNSICDVMYIASGASNRMVNSIADDIEKALKEAGIITSVEGRENCQWVLIDAGPVIVHLFQPEARQYYHIEDIWQKKTIS